MWRGESSRTAIVGGAILVFLACCVLPLVHLLATSLTRADAYATLLLDARQRRVLASTAILASGTAILATMLGVPLGVALARIALPFKAALRVALTVPVLLPPYVLGLAWTYLWSGSGPVARLVGRDVPGEWTYSLTGAVIVLGIALYPLSMLATEAAIREVDGRLEDAARIVVSPGRVLWRITLPLAAPAIAAAALVIFVLAASEFGVPGLLRVRVYTTEVFTAFAALYDFGRAIVLTVPLLVLSVAAAGLAGVIAGDRLVAGRRRSTAPSSMLDGCRRPAIAAVLVVLTAALVAPLAILVGEAQAARSVPAVLSGSGPAIARSLVLAAVGATLVVIVASVIGHARARARARPGAFVDVMLIGLFAVPGTVVAVGLIGLWNRPGWPGAVYGTDAMLVLGYLARFIPVAALALAAASRAVPASQEEAAAVSGAGWVRTTWHIVLPQLRLGLLATWVIVFVLAFGELGVSILVVPPGEATLPIRIYTIIANTAPAHVAALALLQAVVVLVPLAGLGALLSSRERS
jgi:iron(III) transport system permease protein